MAASVSEVAVPTCSGAKTVLLLESVSLHADRPDAVPCVGRKQRLQRAWVTAPFLAEIIAVNKKKAPVNRGGRPKWLLRSKPVGTATKRKADNQP